MDINEFSQALLNEFIAELNCPNVDLSNVQTGYGVVESILLTHIDEFTEEQWEVILNRRYDYLFQKGTPHYSWRTDREDLAYEVLRRYKPRPYSTWSETWYDCRAYSVRLKSGVILYIKVEESKSLSGQNHIYVQVADTFVPVPTHRAVLLRLGNDTRVYIADQFAGTLDQCENWVAKAKNVKGNIFKIIAIQ